MNIPDELFETNENVDIHYTGTPVRGESAWVVKTSCISGVGHSFEKAYERNKENVRREELKNKFNEFLMNYPSKDNLEALNTFLETNQ